MSILVFENGVAEAPTRYRPRSAPGVTAGSEKWLQDIVFRHPELIPIDEIDHGSAGVAPLCRELTLPRRQGSVYLDILGVTRRGRPVLVECKLWRNPQARREVIGQILEYAALLKRLSYADISAQVAAKAGISSSNPIWDLASGPLGLTDEAGFVDAFSDNLGRGDFDLIVLGDGIRSEIEAVRGYLEAAMGLRSRFALVEVRAMWSDSGAVALTSNIALRSQVIEHQVQWFAQSELATTEHGVEVVERETDRSTSVSNRAFWDRFIDCATFAHPDQPAPTHGGNNWVRLGMPKPFQHVTAYRSIKGAPHGRIGVFTVLRGEIGEGLYQLLAQSLNDAQKLLSGRVRLQWGDQKPDEGFFAVDLLMEDPISEEAQLAWLRTNTDAFTAFVRERIGLVGID